MKETKEEPVMDSEELIKALGINGEDYFYIIHKGDKMSYFCLYKKAYEYYEENGEKKVKSLYQDFYIFNKIDMKFWKKMNIHDFFKEYDILPESVNDNDELQRVICDIKDFTFEIPKGPINAEEIWNDTPAYRKKVEDARYQSFIEKMKKTEVGKFIYFQKSDIKASKHLKVFMTIDNISFVRNKNGYPTVELSGNSIQLSDIKSSFGQSYGCLCGNEYSYVDIGSVDALMYLFKSGNKRWRPYFESNRQSCIEYIERNCQKQIEYFNEKFDVENPCHF